jgi:hypothetical protein
VKSTLDDDGVDRERPKSRGPGVAMLTSKGSGGPVAVGGGTLSRSRTVAKSPSTGESAKQAVPTIACGTPGVSGVFVVTKLVCFLFCTRGCGCGVHPAFRAPSFEGAVNESGDGAPAPSTTGLMARGCLNL